MSQRPFLSHTRDDGHRRAGRRLGNLRVDLPSSKVPAFITPLLTELIITDELAFLFRNAGLTGYRLQPVTINKVQRGKKEDVPLLWEFVVAGRGGDAHPKSGITLQYECSACGYSKYIGFTKGLYIDETQWDGSDFFTVWPLPRFIIVTERVRDFIIKHRLDNCRLTPTEELRSRSGVGELSPGMKAQWIKGNS